MKYGAFTFVLHSHLPYIRQTGRWPRGEDQLHEMTADTYLPLLSMLSDLAEHEVPARFTLAISPLLAEQLGDPLVAQHFESYLLDGAERAAADVRRFERAGDPHARYLAHWYEDRFNRTLATFRGRFHRDLIGAARRLQDSGHLEILASAATHGYLPLASRDSSIAGQVATGVRAYRRHFQRDPRGFWLPECAYRPATVGADGLGRPGLETYISEHGMRMFFAETHAVVGGRPTGKAMNDVFGPYRAVPRRYALPAPAPGAASDRTTARPYRVEGSDVAVFGRNSRTGIQVWSASYGYPGDFDYREIRRRDGLSGLRYWRVTGPRVDLPDKDWYHPDWAEGKISSHAHHFARLIEDLAREHYERTGEFGIIAAMYDAELFGHWWFEGVRWLGEVLARLARSEAVELSTAGAYLDAHPPEESIAVPESSWGMAGRHFTWDNVDTAWMWPIVHAAEARLEQLVSRYPRAEGKMLNLLSQTARELLLLQSSDWPFLITTGQAAEYASHRFREHAERFDRLAALADSSRLDAEADHLLAYHRERDGIFEDIDYRDWAPRPGSAARATVAPRWTASGS